MFISNRYKVSLVVQCRYERNKHGKICDVSTKQNKYKYQRKKKLFPGKKSAHTPTPLSLNSKIKCIVPKQNKSGNSYNFYYPTAPRRVQITPKTSTNIMRYLYSRGLVRQVCLLLTNQLAAFSAPILFRFAYFCRAFPVNKYPGNSTTPT